MKILCLGNEFLEEDSLAKKVGLQLSMSGVEVINIKDSFQLMEWLNKNQETILIDVVRGLKQTRILGLDELKNSKIMSAHDFDAGFILKLLKPGKIKLIGIPQQGKVEKVVEEVRLLL